MGSLKLLTLSSWPREVLWGFGDPILHSLVISTELGRSIPQECLPSFPCIQRGTLGNPGTCLHENEKQGFPTYRDMCPRFYLFISKQETQTFPVYRYVSRFPGVPLCKWGKLGRCSKSFRGLILHGNSWGIHNQSPQAPKEHTAYYPTASVGSRMGGCMFCPMKWTSYARTHPSKTNPLHLITSISSLGLYHFHSWYHGPILLYGTEISQLLICFLW